MTWDENHVRRDGMSSSLSVSLTDGQRRARTSFTVRWGKPRGQGVAQCWMRAFLQNAVRNLGARERSFHWASVIPGGGNAEFFVVFEGWGEGFTEVDGNEGKSGGRGLGVETFSTDG